MFSEINEQDKSIILAPKSKQDALVSGYIRESIILYPFTLPICIIKLCLSFFNTIQYFKFEKETLTNFLNSTKDDIWEGKPFNTHGIMFGFVLSPNGFTAGQIGFFALIKCLPASIDRVVLKATLFCHETGAFYTNTRQEKRFVQNFDEDMEIGTDCMTSISDCKYKKCLTFSGNIEVLQIHYKSHISKPVWNCTNIQMRSKNVCKWIIDRKALKKELYFGKFIDNRNWVLFLHNGRIKLRLLDLPRNVIGVSIKCKMKLVTKDCLFSLATNTHRVSDAYFKGVYDKEIETVLVHLELEVYEIFKRNCVSIQKQYWEKYGIVN